MAQKKLNELEKKFNKKPNIIFILSDDVGWGELGSYLGGKLRGTPTPNLDKNGERRSPIFAGPMQNLLVRRRELQ